MPLDLAMSVMSGSEFLLWAVLAFLFWKKGMRRSFPAMGAYLALRVVSTPILLLLLYGQSQHWLNDYCYPGYFFGYFAVYAVSAVLIFFICMEVFRSALSGFSGLVKFGLVIFRWVSLASVIITFSSVSFSNRGILLLPDIAYGLMRSVCIIELCLLAFLCLSMNALRLSVRSMAFGIALGFGLFAANDFIALSVISHSSSLTAPMQVFNQAVVLVGIGVWVLYSALPQPARKPVVFPVNSTIYRWNEIASALGHPGTQVAEPQPAGSFFLTDVEKVVDRVLNRSLKESESKS